MEWVGLPKKAAFQPRRHGKARVAANYAPFALLLLLFPAKRRVPRCALREPCYTGRRPVRRSTKLGFVDTLRTALSCPFSCSEARKTGLLQRAQKERVEPLQLVIGDAVAAVFQRIQPGARNSLMLGQGQIA